MLFHIPIFLIIKLKEFGVRSTNISMLILFFFFLPIMKLVEKVLALKCLC